MIGDLAERAPDTRALVEALVEALLDALADRMEEAAYTKGSPIATVALEVAATNDPLQKVCADAYDGWQRALADRLAADGHAAGDAEDLACSLLALIEGALVLARAQRSRTPIERARRTAGALLGS